MTDLLDLMQPTADDLASQGMNRALDHADATFDRWGDRAYELLASYALTNFEFMTEEVRSWAEKLGLPKAPSARAWGAVALRASREGIIEKYGYQKTRNPLAHGTPATLWRSRIYRQAA